MKSQDDEAFESLALMGSKHAEGFEANSGVWEFRCEAAAYVDPQADPDEYVFGGMGISLEIVEWDQPKGEDRREGAPTFLLLDPDEADALATALRSSAAAIRSGQFEREAHEHLEAQRSAWRQGVAIVEARHGYSRADAPDPDEFHRECEVEAEVIADEHSGR